MSCANCDESSWTQPEKKNTTFSTHRSTDYRKVPIAKMVTDSNNEHKNNKDDEIIWKGSDVIVQGIVSLPSVQEHLTQTAWQGTDMTWERFLGQAENGDNNKNNTDWTAFTNEKLAPLLYPNICRTLADSYTAFGYVNHADSPFTWMQKQSIRTLGSLAMYLAASRVKST